MLMIVMIVVVVVAVMVVAVMAVRGRSLGLGWVGRRRMAILGVMCIKESVRVRKSGRYAGLRSIRNIKISYCSRFYPPNIHHHHFCRTRTSSTDVPYTPPHSSSNAHIRSISPTISRCCLPTPNQYCSSSTHPHSPIA
jgi:hypothetical protein